MKPKKIRRMLQAVVIAIAAYCLLLAFSTKNVQVKTTVISSQNTVTNGAMTLQIVSNEEDQATEPTTESAEPTTEWSTEPSTEGGSTEPTTEWSTDSETEENTGFFQVIRATSGEENEGSTKLLDGKYTSDDGTKWCVTGFSSSSKDEMGNIINGAYIIFKSAEPIYVTGYTIVTGNDNSKEHGRNPQKWTLYGCTGETKDRNDTGWKVIHSVENDTALEDKDYQKYVYTIDSPPAVQYQYFKLEIEEIQNNSVMQMSELILDYYSIHETAKNLDDAKTALQKAILNRNSIIKLTLTGDALTGITTDNMGEKGTALYTEAGKHIAAGEPGRNAKLGDYFAKTVGGYSVKAEATCDASGNILSVTYIYQVTYYTDKTQEDAVDSRLSEIYTSLQLSDSTLTDAQKVWKIYDWITNHVTYDYEKLNDDTNKTKYTAYGALTDGKAVCQGFAGLFYRMCMDNGIDCRIVTGTAANGQSNGAHAWNIVRVGEAYYYVDATWDCKVLADEANGRQAKPGTLYYFLRSSLDNHTESETEKVTGGYTIAAASLAGIQIEIPDDVTKDTMSASAVVLKDLCGTALTAEQLAWYRVNVTNDTTYTCKWSVTVTPGAVGLDSIVLAEETVYTHGEADKDGNCTVCNGKIKYIVAAYLYDVNGNDVAGVMTGLGAYLPEEEVTLTAPFVVGYNFVGWYVYSGTSANKYTGENLCTSRTYKFKASQDTNLVAVYKPIGSAGLTINGGKSFTINGDSKTTEVETAYPLGSQITVVCNDDDFEYWKNSAGMVLSRDKSYTFTVTGKETISAVFNTIAENKATVVFESYYGQVIARDQYAAGAALTEEPGLPFRYGYTVLGWDYNGDGSYNAETDTFAKALERGFASEERHVTILPVYQLKDITYNITVENGTGTGAYKQNDVVTVVANAASEGNKFCHWADEAGNILSYNENYQFYAAKNMKVTAVYVKIADMVETKGTTEIVDKIADREKEKLTFVSMSTVPEGCTINKAGMILTDDATVANGDSFNASTAKYVLGDAWSGTAYRYSVNINRVSAEVTWYVRAYLVYTDAEGNVYTIYGQMESLTM